VCRRDGKEAETRAKLRLIEKHISFAFGM